MADFNKLKDTIRGAIYPNGRGAISADKHQAALLDMADTMQETDTKLTELSAEVEECSNILKGKTWQDINVRFTDERYVYAKDDHLIGDIFYNANYKATEFIEVANTDKIRITCASCNGENADKGLVFYDSAKNVIVGLIFSDGTENNAVRELDIPTNAQYVRTTFNKSVGGEFLCQLLLEGESLSAVTERIVSVVDGTTWQDVSTTLTDTYYVYAKDNQLLGGTFYNASYIATDYIDVSDTSRILITCASDSNDKGLAFYDSDKVVIEGMIFNDATPNNDVRELQIPQGAYYVRSTINKEISQDFVCKKFIQGQSLVEQIDSKAPLSDIENLYAKMMGMDGTSVIAVDLMQLIHSQNKINSTKYMPIASSTSSSITLSSEDAAYFPTAEKYAFAAVVGFANGDYKVVYFSSANGTTINKAAFDNTDLSNAVSVQSVHNTTPGGQGQHLSQSGYIAMGKFVADEILKRTSLVDKNWIGGIIFNQCERERGYQNTDEYNAVYDADGKLICEPIFVNWMWGGVTPNGKVANRRGVSSDGDLLYANGWITQAYRFMQGKEGAYVEFPIKVSGRGFVEIQAATMDGECNLSLYVDGELVETKNLVANQTKYIWENIKAKNEISARFTTTTSADTYVAIYSIGMWEMYQTVPLPIVDSVTKIAVLGDSWTQFPNINNGLTGFAEWNEVVVRPDNTQGDGYGYFPKALAMYTGAIVDNWGKSGMRADNWGLPNINKILESARYDYLVYNFCINDKNAGISVDAWLSTMKRIASKCKPFGTRPVFVLPCCTDSQSQSAGLGIWHEAALKGLFVE